MTQDNDNNDKPFSYMEFIEENKVDVASESCFSRNYISLMIGWALSLWTVFLFDNTDWSYFLFTLIAIGVLFFLNLGLAGLWCHLENSVVESGHELTYFKRLFCVFASNIVSYFLLFFCFVGLSSPKYFLIIALATMFPAVIATIVSNKNN